MFHCPHCQHRLAHGKTDFAMTWVCPRCHGRAVNLAVLRQVTRTELIKELWSFVVLKKGHPGRPCPGCQKAMYEVPTQSAAGLSDTDGFGATLWVDICSTCQWIWFDPTEFEKFPQQRPFTFSQEVQQTIALFEVARAYEGSHEAQKRAPGAAWKYIPALLGLPTEEKADNFNSLPWVTWLLVLLVSSISSYAFFFPEEAIASYALIPREWTRLGGLTLLSSFFLHGGLMHLIGNMYFLMLFGDNVEDVLGKGKYLSLILLSTLVGGLLFTAANLDSNISCIGASGGISGILVYYLLAFPHHKLGVLIWYRWLRLPSGLFLAFWIVSQLLILLNTSSSIAALAHLGGGLVGLVFWWLHQPRSNTPPNTSYSRFLR